MQLLIAADLAPTKSNINLFNKADTNSLLGEELLSLWNSADVRIFNLEVPLTDEVDPIAKCGPNLIAPTSAMKGIKALNPTLITLANNHIMDQGVRGLNSTRNLLKSNNISYTGIGNNLYKASKPYIINQDRVKIGIYACTEREFTIAEENKPGANPFDPLESLDHIYKLKMRCDYVIVLYHGGKEYYRYPSPQLQRVCRKMVEKGANLVITQHSHCIGCFEEYKGATIVYGQGNFIFNKCDNEFWNTSLIVKVNVKEGFHLEYIPIIKNGNGVRLAVGEEGEKILKEFYKRSKDILKEGFIINKYEEFAKKNIENYLRHFSGFRKWKSRIDRYLLGGMLVKRKYNKRELLTIQNFVECEAHRELVIKGLSITYRRK